MNTYLGTQSYREAIAKFLSKVKFNCDFKDNVCACQRVDGTNLATADVGCCCGRCAPCVGYLNLSTSDPFWIEHYQDKFNRHLGFYRKGIGCILPREFRSATCNRYMCAYLYSQMSAKDGDKVDRAQDDLSDIIYKGEN
jgi:hypothetical protein